MRDPRAEGQGMGDGADAADLVDRALALHNSGRLDEAAALYKKILRQDPDHADALHLLGLTLQRRGELEIAAALIRRAIKRSPSVVSYHTSLAETLTTQGRIEDALAALDEAARLDPKRAQVHDSRGILLRQLGRLEEGLTAHDQAIQIDPGSPETHNNRGAALMELGRLPEALDAFDRALSTGPDIPEIHANRGNCLMAIGNAEAALAAFDKAIAINSEHVDGLNGRGAALWSLGRHEEALACLDACAGVNPDHAGTHNNRGTVLRSLGRLGEALAAFDRAIDLKPDFAQAHNNRGGILKDQARIGEALAAYRRAAEIAPDFHEAHSNYLFCLNYDPSADDRTLFQAHRDWGAAVSRRATAYSAHANARDPDKALRVGLVSADFRHHPVGYLTEGVLASADPARLQLLIYSGNTKEDDLTERLKQRAQGWHSTNGMPDQALAEAIRADQVDILVDLSGHTSGNRLPCFALKPTPVQASWLGYCHTTGLPAMDYILADPTFVPADGEQWFTETVVRLPHTRWCYAPPDYAPAVGPPPHMEQGHITFGSFNNLAKVNEAVIDLWAQILHVVSHSRLMLTWITLADPNECARLRKAFQRRGIAGRRIEFSSGAERHAGVLAQYDKVDVALDPFPFCGGLTTCEALWMGVPVVTLPDTRPASRQSMGILTAIERTEWIAASSEDFVRIVTDLVRPPDALQAMRQEQRDRMAASPICDGARFAGDLEAALRQMWHRWCRDGSG